MAPESTAKEASMTDMGNSSLMEEHKVEEEEEDEGSDMISTEDINTCQDQNRSGMWTATMVVNTNPILKIVKFSPTRKVIKNTVSASVRLLRGFIPEPLSGIYPIKYLDEIAYRNMTARELMTNLANLCVKKLNDEKGKTVELVEIVRAIESGGVRWNSYITFMAREYPNGPLVEYQAKVMNYAGNAKPPFPILCRPSPEISV
ncbi:unnamed protein product [Arabidopsis arenosa]|uniref:Uncharacterized protein n=1 Tax=Arabidopsis arenosa TaxID=38785 RepID=A0A8S2AHI3_ARAAE|nr:unnamed protein product [Arabidopsis arenosa]